MEEAWGMPTNIITPIQLQAGLCIIQHLCFTEMLHSIIYMTENNKCFLQMHLLAEALHSDIIPEAGVQSSGS
ncbi:hypothetical protein CGO55_21520 [Salmonella enterica]|nr:hypothetical protein [Salmonella enterica]EDW4825278.1 hypothetical protein [Salmonella enterica subsp. enterica]EEF0005444.1 hypothetical protein [Salmonella enterica subsp. enterica serovar Braenderup]EBH4883344.1 hypothetical protein [Salmonella enterica]EBR5578512.1 hypothetical protein [Salmonella enterica]